MSVVLRYVKIFLHEIEKRYCMFSRPDRWSAIRNYTYFTLLLNCQHQNKSLHNQLLLLVKQRMSTFYIVWID